MFSLDNKLAGYKVRDILITQANRRYELAARDRIDITHELRCAATSFYTRDGLDWRRVDHIARRLGCPGRFLEAPLPRPLHALSGYDINELMGNGKYASRPEGDATSGPGDGYYERNRSFGAGSNIQQLMRDAMIKMEHVKPLTTYFNPADLPEWMTYIFTRDPDGHKATTLESEDPMNQFTITQTQTADRYTVVDVEAADSFSSGDLDEILFAGTLDDCTTFIKDEVAKRATAAAEAAAKAAADKEEADRVAAEKKEAQRRAAIVDLEDSVRAYEASIEGKRAKLAELQAAEPAPAPSPNPFG